jgi:hypothetical protein
MSTMDAGYMQVKQVACKIGMSSDWVRRFFGEIEGVRKIKSPAKRSRRPDTILLIPTAIGERELRKLATGPQKSNRTESLQVVGGSSAPP